MSTYREIHGKAIKSLSSDPSDDYVAGQIWYNTTSDTFKTVVSSEAWASSSSLIAPRVSGAGFGVSTAAVYASGQQAPGPGTTTSYEYNGSGWSSGGTINTGRYEIGGTTAGILTAGVIFGGNTAPGWNGTTATEEYNGTAWTSVNNMATTVSFLGGSGIQTAAFSAGGRTPSSTNNSQEYDGTNWANGNNINTTRQALAGMGTQTAGIIAGGEAPGGGTNATETYNGTSWTSAPNLGTARYRLSGSGSASTACLVFGGRYNPPAADKAQTESFDGTSWTEKGDLATARQQLSGNRGTSSSAIAAGGIPPGGSQTDVTEEWNVSTNVITAGAWASTPSLGTARRQVGGFGHTTTTAVCACGQNPPAQSLVEEYDGSSWSEVNNAPIARVKPFACGTLTAGLIGGGESGPSPTSFQSSAEYDGTNWTASPSSAIPGGNAGDSTAFGTQTAAVLCMGSSSPDTAVKDYDGSTWTAGTATPIKMASSSGNGTNTAGLIYTNSDYSTSACLAWNGSSWTSGGTLIAARSRAAEAVGAPSTAALLFAGDYPAPTEHTSSYGYDGTAWATNPNMATARRGLGGAGINTAALAFAGYTGSDTAASEEFTGETSAANVKTLTQS